MENNIKSKRNKDIKGLKKCYKNKKAIQGLEVNEHGIAGFKLVITGGIMLCAGMFQNSPYAGAYVFITLILFAWVMTSEIKFLKRKLKDRKINKAKQSVEESVLNNKK